MARTTTYKCDRCGNEDTDNKTVDLKFVMVGIRRDRYSSSGSEIDITDAQNRTQEMCKACRLELGIEPTQKPKADIPEAYPTIEELIREIVRE